MKGKNNTMSTEKTVAKKSNQVNLTISGLPSAKLSIDLEGLREVRNSDNRGHAKFALMLGQKHVVLNSNGNAVPVELLLQDSSKKSKGSSKSEIELM